MQKFTILISMFIIFFSACSQSKNWVGKINGKEIQAQDFSRTLKEKYAYQIEQLKSRYKDLKPQEAKKALKNDLKQIFSDLYKAKVFVREGEKIKFFQQPAIQNQLNELKTNILIQSVEKELWEKDIRPLVKNKYSAELQDSDYRPYQKQILLSHILLTFKKNSSKVSLNKALSLRKKIKSGKISFAEAAKKFSEDPGSKNKQGSLGWADRETPFVAEFRKAAFQLNKGQISSPVKTPYGYHLILVQDVKKRPLNELKTNKKLTLFIKKQKKDLYKAKIIKIAKNYTRKLRQKFKNKIHCNPSIIFQYFQLFQKFIKNKHPELLENASSSQFRGKYSYIVHLKDQIASKAPIILQKFHETYPNRMLCKVDGANEMTVYEIASAVGSKLPVKVLNAPGAFADFLAEYFIASSIRFLEGKEKGYHKNPNIAKQTEFAVIHFKGNVYREYLRKQVRNKIKSQLQKTAIKKYYESHLNEFENQIPTPISEKDMLFLQKHLKNQEDYKNLLSFYQKNMNGYTLKKGSSKNTVWKILEKTPLKRYQSFLTAAPQVEKILVGEKEMEKMQKLTKKLLKKYKIETNSSIEAINIQ